MNAIGLNVPETAMAGAFRKAGHKSQRDRLMEIAVGAWAQHSRHSAHWDRIDYVVEFLKGDLTYSLLHADGLLKDVRGAISLLLREAEDEIRASQPAQRVRNVLIPVPPESAAVYALSPASQAAIERAAKYREKRDAMEQKRLERVNEERRRVFAEFEDLFKAKAWYDAWLMTDGSSVMDADNRKLVAESVVEDNASVEHRRKARFYRRLADVVPAGKTVRDVDQSQLTMIRREVFAAVPPS